MNLFDLSGKVAMVTGAGRGLGRASALALAEAGADIEAGSRTSEELATLADEVRALGRQATVHTLDIRSIPDIRRTVDDVIATHGRIDILVKNAGTNVQQDVLDVTEEG